MFYGSGATRNPLYPRSYEYCRSYWPDSAVRGVPLFYADYDYKRWLIAPTPSSSYSLEINYYEMPALLDDTNSTNWLTEYAPNVLLYRALVETAPFLGADSRIAVWQGLYKEALSSFQAGDLRKIIDRTTTRKSS